MVIKNESKNSEKETLENELLKISFRSAEDRKGFSSFESIFSIKSNLQSKAIIMLYTIKQIKENFSDSEFQEMNQISALTIDLKEEYKNSLLIQHCRGDDKDPSRRLILQKCLREKYASKLKEICKDNQSKNFYARILYRKLTPAKFRDIEMCINWNMFEKNGQCANDALALVTREEFPEIGNESMESDRLRRCKKRSKFTCSKCMKVSYCSKDCSIQYWRYHKKICKEIRDIASEVD